MSAAPQPDGIYRTTWALIVIISEANEDGEFFVELEDPRYGGAKRVIARENFKDGDDITEWIARSSRDYLNQRARELHR